MIKNRNVISMACFAALIVGASFGCGSPSRKPKPTLGSRPECPHSWGHEYDTTVYEPGSGPRFTPISQTQFSLPGVITDVPEFHDCQRLISVTNPNSYDQLAAIFARYNLDSIFAARRRANPRPLGLTRENVDRLLVVSGRSGAPVYRLNASVVAQGIAVAEIVSEGKYAPLGIGAGFNCLYLDGNGAAWSAVMVYEGPSELSCDGLVLDRSMSVTPLWVKTGAAAPRPTDVPAVARWDFDERHSRQLASVKCDDRWCTIGSQANMDAPPPAGDASSPKQQSIKGWYDEQRLAEFDPLSKKLTGPGKVIGTVIPDVELGTYTLPMFDDPSTVWLPVAHVALNKQSQTYEAKYGFQPVPSSRALSSMNDVYLCKGSADRCQIPTELTALRTNCVSIPNWWAKSQMGSAPPKYFCVRYRGYSLGFSIPAVARWRWRANDETIWVSCPEGCCETDSFDK